MADHVLDMVDQWSPHVDMVDVDMVDQWSPHKSVHRKRVYCGPISAGVQHALHSQQQRFSWVVSAVSIW